MLSSGKIWCKAIARCKAAIWCHLPWCRPSLCLTCSLQFHCGREMKKESCRENRTKKSKNPADFGMSPTIFSVLPFPSSFSKMADSCSDCSCSCFFVISVIGYQVFWRSEVQRKVSCANNLRFNVEQLKNSPRTAQTSENVSFLSVPAAPPGSRDLHIATIENEWNKFCVKNCQVLIPISVSLMCL